MVGSGVAVAGGDRSKEAVGMMALHDTLRNVCLNSDWTYSVFWTIRPRPRVRGGTGCKVGDDNGSLMLMWEDGFCRARGVDCVDEINGEDPVQKAFRKMSIQLYNYGEGLMGKVASDKCHKWVFKEPSECEPNVSNYWQSSFDAVPTEWTDQFESGIQTIAVIQAGHGLLQLGSCKIIPEDLHFVLRMRHTFESLGYQSGFYLSQLFSSNRTASSSSPIVTNQAVPPLGPPPILNWSQSMLPTAAASMLASPNYQRPPLGFAMPHSAEGGMEEMPGEQEPDIKWPSGLSFFNALTGRAEVFNPESLGNKPDETHPDVQSLHAANGATNPNEFLSLDSHPDSLRKMENKFRRSFTMPARMASSSSSTSLDHHHTQHPPEYRSSETAMYHDLMEPFME